ncbi:MAG: hypothetical protein JW744_03585 [Candidatus Diapherotrites archaeon]|uniref:Uncharacterized protein n=1 Tax=Candidatus Iainarchaeum sp. TaxID=3101447 RepID=A0A938YNQ3_9ARCH|nr:hypothetical protein [Candidatus Diapherotrites archaeon]
MAGGNTAEILIALVIVVGSFMYVYDSLVRLSQMDVLLAVLAFGGGLVYLFSNIWGK